MLSGACSTTSGPKSAGNEDLAAAVRGVIGTNLIGAKGKTKKDQDGIDDTVAGACSIGSYSQSECVRHGQETQQP